MEEHLRTSTSTRFTERGLSIRKGGPSAPEETEIDLFSGEMHYFRIPRPSWSRCLRTMKEIGFRIVSTYVPWGVHETAEGACDFGGDLDLGAFLDEVERAGMYAILRPGPHINAELTFFGYPERILREEEMLALSARDTPVWMPVPPRMFPVPSYASKAFRAQVGAWFRAVADIAAPRLAPDGPVIAVQADNEMQMFFRVGAYDHDYHPDALKWWREFAPEAGDPPRAWDPAEAERCVTWVRFKEEYAARALAWVAEELRSAGFSGLAMFHNLPPTDPRLANLPRAEAALELGGLVGLDFYHNARDYDSYRRRALHLVGSAAPLPFSPEVGAGGPPWLLPMSAEDQENVTLGLLASGLRAMNFYMAVDRDRWYGAPIAPDGERRDSSWWLERLLALLEEVNWTGLRRQAPVALVLSRADARFATASSLADPITPVIGEFLGLGPAGAAELSGDPAAAEQRRWFGAVERALSMAQVPYDIVDEDCPAERLERYRAVVLPTLDRVDRAAWKRLHHAAQNGAQVVIGPGRPTRDECDRLLQSDASPPPRAGLIRAGSREDLVTLAADLEQVAGDLPDVWISVDRAAADCSVFVDAQGTERICFVANRTGSPTASHLAVPQKTRLLDPFTDARFAPNRAGIVKIPLEPYQVRAFRIEPPG